MTRLTTLVRGCGSAGAAGAGVGDTVVAAVFTAPIDAGVKEFVVGALVGPDVLTCWDVFSPRWAAAVNADATSPMVSAKERVSARLKVFDAFRSAESPLSWVSSASSASSHR